MIGLRPRRGNIRLVGDGRGGGGRREGESFADVGDVGVRNTERDN